MAQITLTIPDAVLPRVRAALCAAYGLPESNANAKQAVISAIESIVRSAEHAAAVAERPPDVEPDVAGIVT